MVGSEDPLSYEDATSSSYNDEWLVVRSKEMKSLHKNKSWELVNYLSGTRPLCASRCVERVKVC